MPIYAIGATHPLKVPCIEVLALANEHRPSFATSAEVLQELVHHYLSVRDWRLGRVILSDFVGLMEGRIEAVGPNDVIAAATMVDRDEGLSARDLLHAAVMQRIGATQIVSTDRGFDRIDGIQRLDPAQVATWRSTIEAADT